MCGAKTVLKGLFHFEGALLIRPRVQAGFFVCPAARACLCILSHLRANVRNCAAISPFSLFFTSSRSEEIQALEIDKLFMHWYNISSC
jgi:hypothetical protein